MAKVFQAWQNMTLIVLGVDGKSTNARCPLRVRYLMHKSIYKRALHICNSTAIGHFRLITVAHPQNLSTLPRLSSGNCYGCGLCLRSVWGPPPKRYMQTVFEKLLSLFLSNYDVSYVQESVALEAVQLALQHSENLQLELGDFLEELYRQQRFSRLQRPLQLALLRGLPQAMGGLNGARAGGVLKEVPAHCGEFLWRVSGLKGLGRPSLRKASRYGP